jgi:hypothetical protein
MGSAVISLRIRPEVKQDRGQASTPHTMRLRLSIHQDGRTEKHFANANRNDIEQLIDENFDLGPKALADKIIADGSFRRRTVKGLWRYLMKRDMNLSSYNGQISAAALLDELTNPSRHGKMRKGVRGLPSGWQPAK